MITILSIQDNDRGTNDAFHSHEKVIAVTSKPDMLDAHILIYDGNLKPTCDSALNGES